MAFAPQMPTTFWKLQFEVVDMSDRVASRTGEHHMIIPALLNSSTEKDLTLFLHPFCCTSPAGMLGELSDTAYL